MFKKFLLSLFFLVASITSIQAQENRANKSADQTVEGLSIYPNPTNSDRLFIVSKAGLDKEVTIFDVLGKKVLQTELSGKELNISSLTPGVYIIKIREEEATATRKLIIK
ncbi:MAG: secretion protein [Flavobacterium sp. BFFFF2]|nr:MAG: secretion protein [Flavobacterium sp. BFFFF2]